MRVSGARKDLLSAPEHALENRIHVLQVIAKVEQRLELIRAQDLGHVLVRLQEAKNSPFPRQAAIALR